MESKPNSNHNNKLQISEGAGHELTSKELNKTIL